jgi:two-component system, OmpR family, sensor histidine kinase SenX3
MRLPAHVEPDTESSGPDAAPDAVSEHGTAKPASRPVDVPDRVG